MLIHMAFFSSHYYIRTGGTTKELTGVALSSFLMERAGKHWDGIPMPGLSVADLDKDAIEAYRRKAARERHSETDLNVSDEQVISDLQLVDHTPRNDGQLMRAAVLMFHLDPERYVTGACVKIAYYAPEGAYGAN
jgi:ATP-dependent DNA helicase RecG